MGTKEMMAHLEKAYQADIKIRLEDEKNPPEGIAIVAELLERSAAARRIIAHHTTPQEAGKVFSAVAPKLAVYTHIVRLSAHDIPEVTQQELVNYTRETYAEPLVVGEDLMAFDIAKDGNVAVFKR